MKPKTQFFGISIVFSLVFLGLSPIPEIQNFGKTVYEKHCLSCHGPEGRGDGPEAKDLTIKPTNFHSSESRMKTDEELFSKVVWGGVYSPMHGWGTRLSQQEIQYVVWYIRLLAPYQKDTQ